MRKYEPLDYGHAVKSSLLEIGGIIVQGVGYGLLARKGYHLWIIPAGINFISGIYEYLMSDLMVNQPWLFHSEIKIDGNNVEIITPQKQLPKRINHPARILNIDPRDGDNTQD